MANFINGLFTNLLAYNVGVFILSCSFFLDKTVFEFLKTLSKVLTKKTRLSLDFSALMLTLPFEQAAKQWDRQ